MKVLALFVLIWVSISLTGCVIAFGDDDYDHGYHSRSNWEEKQEENRETIDSLTLGMSKDEVINMMGSADFNEALQKDGNGYQLLWFRTQHRRSDGKTTKDETTPLIFKNDELVGWGQTALDKL